MGLHPETWFSFLLSDSQRCAFFDLFIVQSGGPDAVGSCFPAIRLQTRRSLHLLTFSNMALLPILEFPDPRLRTRAQPVEQVDAALRKLIDDMFETMYAAPGIGLAATQVNVHKRLLVMDISDQRNQRLALINPEIVSHSGLEETEEGCLSVP